jgi:hypothetical protein
MEEGKNYPTKKGMSVSFTDLETSDLDEEKGINSPRSPTSPKVIISARNYERECCVSFVIIFLLLLFMVVFKMLFPDSQTEDVSGTNKLTAKIYSQYSRNHHRCDDKGFDCCYIYTKGHNYQISPRYIVAKDEVSSNCPSLTKLVNGYNNYLNDYDYNVNCTEVTCCKIDNSEEIKVRYHSDAHELLEVNIESKGKGRKNTCPKVEELISKYIHNYPSPYEDMILLSILGAILCCLGISSSRGGKRR